MLEDSTEEIDNNDAARATGNDANAKNQAPTTQFPDILQFLPSDEIKKQVELHANNEEMINKKGTIGYAALHWACVRNDLNLIKFLVIDCKAQVDVRGNLGETPLFICVKNCNFLAIEFLLNYGADLTIRDTHNRSIVHWSAYTGKTIMFHYFQKYHKIQINDIDKFEQTALHIATACNHEELARYLISTKEFNLYDQDFNGNTVLHMAVKSGSPRLTWFIFENSGRRLLSVQNKLYQTPLELIVNDTSKEHLAIADWLSFERKNNNEYFTMLMLYKSWLYRFLLPLLTYITPLLVNLIIFDQNELNGYKGFVAYFSVLSTFVYFLRSQRHRITHISGLQNPFYLGFFLNVFVQNYISYYVYYFGVFSITNFGQVFVVCLTVVHAYSLFKLLFLDPGFTKKNSKREDGTELELKDLFRTNIVNDETVKPNEIKRENIFCETCQIVINKPTKHCKLCGHCCLRFDHHCLFLLRCVGINNHRLFIILLLSSITCIVIYLSTAYSYIKEEYQEVTNSFFYFVFSSNKIIWLCILFLTNIFGFFMILFLLIFQFTVLSHGFTSQFRPGNLNRLKLTWRDKFKNLKIFFFESNENLMALYLRQAKADYLLSNRKPKNESLLGSSIIDMNVYNRNSSDDNHDCSEHGHSH